MVFRGERFILDLDDDDDSNVITSNQEEGTPSVVYSSSPIPSLGLIGEIRERSPSAAVPPAPKPPSGTGFPQHRQRTRTSAFKQRRSAQQQPPEIASIQNAANAQPATATQPAQSAGTNTREFVDDEKKAIDQENRRHLASMSASQIEQEREELMSTLDPSLLERFLRRAKIDDDDAKQTAQDAPSAPAVGGGSDFNSENQDKEPSKTPKKSVSFDLPETSTALPQPAPSTASTSSVAPFNEDLPPTKTPEDLHPASELPSASFHFPTPPPRQNPMPNLDPSSPSFLSDLQTHYFPEISHDPSALSWLQQQSDDAEDPESTSAYHPASSAVSVSPSALRFSLSGTVLSPSTSLSLPTTLGLHHHGDDPQAAGYTIPELAILGRSSFPAQRCVAWQVLGRILFRLGKGEFGERGSTLVEGLWAVIERENVVASMLAEADGALPEPSRKGESAAGADDSKSGIGRHASATAWAVEGVWLWQKGGGGDRGLLKEGVIRSQ